MPPTNVTLTPRQVCEQCQSRFAREVTFLLKTTMFQPSLSPRRFTRVLKVTPTITNISMSRAIDADRIAELVQHRRASAKTDRYSLPS